ncbi:MAG: Gfo/Idh/MocA family protein [Acidimicrobiia bacterium]
MATENGAVGLASIGLGWWGNMLAAGATAGDSARIVSCFARTEATREAFAEKHGCRAVGSLEEIWSDPEVDGVLIATPHSVRAEVIEQAAAAGKHIFIEKPLALTGVEARASADAAQAAGVTLQVGHNKRRQTGNRRLHEMLTSGELGELQHLEANISVPVAFNPNLPEWRKKPEQIPAGGMTPLGVHHVDTIQYLGGPIKSVSAISKRVSGRLDVDDVTAMLFELERGPLAYLVTLLATAGVNTVTVFGSDAAAWSEEDGTRLFLQKRGQTSREEISISPIDTVADEMAEFANCIRTGAAPETGPEAAIPVVDVLEAIIESAETRRTVDVG